MSQRCAWQRPACWLILITIHATAIAKEFTVSATTALPYRPATALPPGPEWGFDQFAKVAAGAGLSATPVVDAAAGATVDQEGRRYLNFAGINFLAVDQDAALFAEFIAAGRRYGLVTGGSRGTKGVARPHLELEQLLAEATGNEAALSFATGLLANIGFAHAMSSGFTLDKDCAMDNTDAVFVLDRGSHWSMFKAVAHLKWGKQAFAFRHNDPEHLETVLRRVAGGKVVVTFETLYSSDGSMAPVGDLLDVCERYGALSYVDDANGFLVYGPAYRPFAAEYAALERANFTMVSFSKAVGLEGGGIAGPAAAVRAFEWLAGTSLFTAAIQPPTAAMAHAVARRLLENPGIIDDYLVRVDRFRSALLDIGCQVSSTPSYIMSVFIGSHETAAAVRDRFREEGILVPIFGYPAVKRNEAILRLILNNALTDGQIEQFLNTLARLKRELRF